MADDIKPTTTPSTWSLERGAVPMTPASRPASSAPTDPPLAATTDPGRQQQQQQQQPPQPPPNSNNPNPNNPGPPPPRFGARPACFKNTLQEVAFVSQATIATATSSFFQGASAIITASIGHDLGMTQGQITWITASTALTAGAFQLGLGQLADLLGRKLVFLVGMASFSALALLVAFSQNPFWMDVVCGLLGVAAAMVVPPAIGIMGAAYDVPSKRKNMAFSAFSAGNPLGFVFGSLVSGLATMVYNWRASFVLIAILWVIFTGAAYFTVPEVEAFEPGQGLGERVRKFARRFDFVGTGLTILGTGLLTAGIT